MEKILDITQIHRILPHRYPFLLVDRIIDYEPGKSVVGIKNVTINEPFFQGHFPGAPVMPGVLIVEAMAQTAGVLMLGSLPDRESKLVFFTGIDGARFRRPVVPGDQLRLELTVLRLRPRYIRLRGEAYVDGVLVAEALIASSLVDRELVSRSADITAAASVPSNS
jgi:3-hydroxyacyl-[acyl-carrier-protein] dehydratase